MKCEWKNNPHVKATPCGGLQYEACYSASGRPVPVCQTHMEMLLTASPFGAYYNEAGHRFTFKKGHQEQPF